VGTIAESAARNFLQPVLGGTVVDMSRVLLVAVGVVLGTLACGGNKPPSSLCETQHPPPAACSMMCDSAVGAPNSCPTGFHCSPGGTCDAQCTQTGDQCGTGNHCTNDGQCMTGMGSGACTGLECDVTDCASKGMAPTTLTGTVLAPNGKLPLFGVDVYVPNADPGPVMAGVQCGSCADGLPGDPIVHVQTDETGAFTLQGVPDGDNIPLVITIGKWRRQIKIPRVTACSTQIVPAADTTLPRHRTDKTLNTTSVDLPQIAISTGTADALECLVRRLGIDDTEITTDKEAGKVHLFADLGASSPDGIGTGTTTFDSSFSGGKGAFSDSQTLWGTATDPGKLDNYDIVILSCEGAQHVETKPQQAMDHLKDYADHGGRVFLSHWHNLWIEGSTTGINANGNKPAGWFNLALWSNTPDNDPSPLPPSDMIDEVHNPKGASFAKWMQNVGGSPGGRDTIPLKDATGRSTCSSVDGNNVEQWVYWQKDPATQLTQNFQFSTPNERPKQERCGKVVFSDMHVSGGPLKNGTVPLKYPLSCGPDAELSSQEKALAFMFFEISACVGGLF
jgi:hypothetical protein